MKTTFLKPTNFIARLSSLIVVIMTIVLALPGTTFSQWQEYAVSTSEHSKTYVNITTDGSGGSIITWQETTTINGIYAQRIGSDGAAMWDANGILICSNLVSSNYHPVIVSDGNYGAIIAWESLVPANSTYDIYAQRVNSEGVLQWSDGVPVPVCTAAGDQNTIAMVSDGSGGAILTWLDRRNSNYQIYAQRVNSDGTRAWTTNGVGVYVLGPTALAPKLINDGIGGAFITWSDIRTSTNWDIYTQHVSSVGAVTETANGVATCTYASDQIKPDICSDGYGGVIITWEDYRAGAADCNIYAQRQVPTALAVQWTTDGIVVNNNTAYNQIDPKIVSDGLGGAIISWTDYRTGAGPGTADIYAQRVFGGAVQWTATGVIICTAEGDQQNSQIASDGNNGAYITWEDYRTGGYPGIYLQHITLVADPTETPGGIAICIANGHYRVNPKIITDGNLGDDGYFGAIVVWEDYRSTTKYDIYQNRKKNIPLPVELASFTFNISGQNNKLKWATVSEQNNFGFDIERKIVTGNWAKIGFIKGQGTVNTPSNYTFEDKNLQTGKYYYRLKQTDYNGNFEYFNLSGFAEVGIPLKYNLSQNYPNPFNPTTKIDFALPNDSKVSIIVYDITGREVMNIMNNEHKTAGYYTININPSMLSSGVYFYRMISDKFIETKKMTIVK